MSGARASHYEALGLVRSASADQVEKAFAFYAAMYEDPALATYSLLGAEELRDARTRVQEAYELLRDPVQRKLYDSSLDAGAASPAEPPEPREPRPAEASPPRPRGEPLPRLLPEPVTGSSLRRAREERGVSLQEIAISTKIGVRFLEYIEAERHAHLPALVYLRGFVQEYARALGLDPRRTADAYLSRLPKL